MATPLRVSQYELDPRAFALQYLATQVNDQGLNVRKNYRRAGWRAVDSFQGFSVPVLHAPYAIKKR
ncbi:hypothetical protein D9M71_251110 [compost metagenome]